MIEPLEKNGWKSLNEVVLIVDACSAGPGVDAAWVEARKINTQTSKLGFWGIAASGRLEIAKQGAFATAFAAVVEAASLPSWTMPHLEPGFVANAVNEVLGPRQTVWRAEGHPAGPCRALPNPRYQDRCPPVNLPLPSAWATAARGVAVSDLPGFFFTGRDSLLHALREHLMGDGDPVAVVTAQPGSGRSALLGQLVLMLHERGRRALPGEVRLAWPALPVTIVAARGDPAQATRMLCRELTGSDDGRELADVLRSAPAPVGIVLDDLDESAEPEQWSHVLGTLRSVPGARVIVGLPAGSAISVPGSPRTYDLDEPDSATAQDVRNFLRRQVQLAVPGAAEEKVSHAADVLAARAGAEFEVAVAVTGPPGSPDDKPSVDDYMLRAENALNVAAHRVCRVRLAPALGSKAAGVVLALSALCSYDDTIALPSAEWAAAASAPGEAPVDARDIATAVRLMRTLAENCPAEDGTARWRARFGYQDAHGYPAPQVFLQRLPQVARWDSVDWPATDPSVLALVAHAAALGLISGRMLDDPAFLLGAPPSIVSKAIQNFKSDPGERTRRAHMWHAVSRNAPPTGDRAVLLRLTAQRFQVRPVVAAFEAACAAPQHDWQPSCAIDWVQPEPSGYTRVLRLAATASGSCAAAVTVQDDDSLAFWDPADGSSLRERVSVPGTPLAVTAAVVGGVAVALVSTWQRKIWLVPCRENAAPTPLPQLVPPPGPANGDTRIVPLLVTLHSSGRVVIARGPEAWIGRLGSGEAVRKLARMESGLLAIEAAGPDDAPVVWLVPESGRVRRLPLGSRRSSDVVPFPLPQRPYTAAVSQDGDRTVIVDVTGGLHLRGTASGDSTLNPEATSPDVRAVAIDASAAVVAGGSAGRSGWVEIHQLTGQAAPARIPLDEAALGIVMPGNGRILVARASGLLSLRQTGHCPRRAAGRPEGHHG